MFVAVLLITAFCLTLRPNAASATANVAIPGMTVPYTLSMGEYATAIVAPPLLGFCSMACIF